MTAPLDLEALQDALGVMDDAAYYLPDAGMVGLSRRLTAARAALANGITELTTRRARDAEAVELVDAAVFALRTRDESGALGDTAEFNLRAALAPFTGAKP